MKKFVFLLFFVIPHLMYASFETHACTKALERVDAEWAVHNALLVQFDALPKGQKAGGVPVVKEAIESCRRAIVHCEYILGKIEHKNKRERQQHYWTHVKEECKQYKTALLNEVERLNGIIVEVFAGAAVDKANTLYQRAGDKANLANNMRKDFPRRLNNVEAVIEMLSEAIKLYEEAGVLLAESLDAIAQYPVEDVKLVIQKALDVYQEAIHHCRKETIEWPAAVLQNTVELKQELALLVAERDLLIKQGNTKDLEDIEKKIAPLIEQLIDCGEKDVAEGLNQRAEASE